MKAKEQYKLLEGEEAIEIIQPHPLAFYRTYAIWVIFAVVGIGIVFFNRMIADTIAPSDISAPLELVNIVLNAYGYVGFDLSREAIADLTSAMYTVTIWWYFLLIFGSLVSFVKINFIWLCMFVGIGIMSTVAGTFLDIPLLIPVLGALFSIAGLFFTSMYRKKHKFIITNYRLVMQVDFFSFKERQLFFSHLSDMAIEQSFVGRLFNFGTLIPISQSGLGLGEDVAMVAGSYGSDRSQIGVAAGRMISVPRGQSSHVLFGVPEPRRIHYLIEQLIHYNESVFHLREIEKRLKHVKFMGDEKQASKNQEELESS